MPAYTGNLILLCSLACFLYSTWADKNIVALGLVFLVLSMLV